MRDIYGSSKKSLEIPAQVSDLLNITKNGQVRVNIESAQIEKAGRELKKGFDHLLLVLIVMALWFSSAILCLSDITPRVLGMPYLSVAGIYIRVSNHFVCIDPYADSEKEIRIMIKQIGTLNIEIERRKIKNINIYVKPPNGDVLVTVPMRVSNEEVFRFLKKKKTGF